MNTWSLERLICDATRYAKAVAAPVLAPLLDFVYPPLTEPTPKVCRAHHETVCIICDEDSDALWMHAADGAEELAVREAEEEVAEPLLPCSCGSRYGRMCSHRDDCDLTGFGFTTADLADEARERIGEVDDFVAEPIVHTKIGTGKRWVDTEPQLTEDELVAVRGLIQERYEHNCIFVNPSAGHLATCPLDHTNFAGAAASLADGDKRAEVKQQERSLSSEPVDPQQTSAHPPAPDSPAGTSPSPAGHPDTPAVSHGTAGATSPAGGPPQLAPAGHPNVEPVEDLYREVETFDDDGPDLATWLEPAIWTALEPHEPTPEHYGTGQVYCCGDRFADWQTWREHVAPPIAKHIAQSLPDYPNPNPQQKGSNQ